MACKVWNIEIISRLPANFLASDHYRSMYISLYKPNQITHKKIMLKVSKYFPRPTTCEFATSSSLLLICYVPTLMLVLQCTK